MSVDVIVGLQRGDEGKGRFVDMFAEYYDIVARYNGGDNAGHTVVLPDGRDFALHLVPSGIAYPNIMNVIANGTLVNAPKLVTEITNLNNMGLEVNKRNLMLSSAANLILPRHIYADIIRERTSSRQGSTKSGIAQAAGDKALRAGARVELIKDNPDGLLELVHAGLVAQRRLRDEAGIEPINELDVAKDYVENARHLGDLVTDTALYLNQSLQADQPARRVLAEGAQAFWLDVDQGMHPYTTSSSTTSGGACIGLGVAPRFIGRVTGVAKAVPSHVGGGPFVTEITNQADHAQLERLHGDMTTVDAEKGTTTGRIRRLGHLDLPQLRRSQMINGVDEMALTKLDWVGRYGDEVKICVAYTLNGERIEIAPDSAYKLAEATPVYESLPTWPEDIQNVRQFADLPPNAQKYIDYIESRTEAPISLIGVGPRRDQVITHR
jgi:adenylosuccinate synthase